MVERFVAAVLQDGVPVDAILAITFTDKAAAQLRARIRARFGDLGEGEAARATERAQVSTIHGFCARVLRGNAVGAGHGLASLAVSRRAIQLASRHSRGAGRAASQRRCATELIAPTGRDPASRTTGSRPAPTALPRSTRAQNPWIVDTCARSVARAASPSPRSPKRARIRARSCAAALSVNVMARMASTGTPSWSTAATNRSTMTEVLPLPALADTNTDPLRRSTTACCSG